MVVPQNSLCVLIGRGFMANYHLLFLYHHEKGACHANPQIIYKTTPTVYTCELQTCPRCAEPLVSCHYLSGRKVVQTMTEVLTIAYRPKRCADPQCPGYQ